MSPGEMTNPGVRFPPPILFVGGLGLAAILESRWSLPVWRDLPGWMLVMAYALVAAGVAWMMWGAVTFTRARTAIIPNRPASRIVTHGPYRFGRNPMYLGMSGVYWGVALWLNTVWAIPIFVVVIALLLRFVIAREERYLSEAFGSEYAVYKQSVHRWLTIGRAG